MVFILKPNQDAKAILTRITQFLSKIGCNVSKSKTRLTASTDGFDFLRWNFRFCTNRKLKIVPSVDNFLSFRKKVKAIVDSSDIDIGTKKKAKLLSFIVRGWRNYHKFCDMRGSRLSLFYIRKRAFPVFNKERKLNRYSVDDLVNKAFPEVGYTVGKHIMAKQDKSSFDGDLVYWSARNSKHYNGPLGKKLAKQSYQCGYCKLRLNGDEKVHLHHVDGDHSNWSTRNLLAVHQSCHQCHHSGINDSKSMVTTKNSYGVQEPDEVKVSRPVLTGRGVDAN